MRYQDRDDPFNGPEYQTGKVCWTPGCNRPAGTWWSQLFCFDCNVKRMDKIDRNLRTMAADLEGRK